MSPAHGGEGQDPPARPSPQYILLPGRASESGEIAQMSDGQIYLTIVGMLLVVVVVLIVGTALLL